MIAIAISSRLGPPLTDAMASRGVRQVATADAAWHDPIEYPAVIVTAARNRAAWDAMMPLRESAPPASPSAWARLRTLALAVVLLAALAALVALVGPVMS